MRLWPALETVEDGSWLWRFAEGLSGRANSLNCLDPDDGADAEKRLQGHAERYRQRGILPTVRLTPLTAAPLRVLTSARDWVEQGHTVVMVKTIDPSSPLAGEAGAYQCAPVSDEALVRVHNRMRGVSDHDAGILARMMQKVSGRAETIILSDGQGEAAAACLAISEGDRAGLFAIITRPDLRRKGYARRLMACAEARMRKLGVSSIALQVEKGNGAARALYAATGFSDIYGYHYRRLQEIPE